jgi:hypothetical protein
LIDLELARNYPFSRADATSPAFRHPLLEQILPSLLHIKAVAVLDAGLKEILTRAGKTVPRTFRPDLNGRIAFLSAERLLPDADRRHLVRTRRNDVAHEFAEAVSWTVLDEDVAAIQAVLANHNLVEPRPRFAFMSERSGARDSTDPRFLCHFDYRFWLQEGDRVAVEVAWTENVCRDEGENP